MSPYVFIGTRLQGQGKRIAGKKWEQFPKWESSCGAGALARELQAALRGPERSATVPPPVDLSLTMLLGDHGMAFLPDGGALPGGSYLVYSRIEVTDEGVVTGEVHFLSEPKYPRPISVGKEFDLHVPRPDSILGDEVVLKVRFVDESGSVAGYAHGSRAQFRPAEIHNLKKVEGTPLNPRDVFVIHGRDERLRAGMFAFLRALGLNPMEWAHAVELTGKGAPYVGEVLDAAFANAQAVVVLFTPDDIARLRPELCGEKEPSHEINLTPQARANVLFEAGMAMARNPGRTILVEVGALRPFSDVGGRHAIRMNGSTQRRNDLASRLKSAGCPVNMSGTDWQTAGDLTAPEIHHATEPNLPTSIDVGRPSNSDDEHALHDLISELEDNLESARAPRVGDVYARPSNRVWKERRNRLHLPSDVLGRVVDSYRRIDRWLDVVSSGLNPNMGSQALDAMTASLRGELPEVIAGLKQLGPYRSPEISEDGRELLLEAAADTNGSVMLVEMNEGMIVQANGRQFAETGNRRSEARWKRAVEELIKLELIDRETPDSQVFRLTHAGYELADKLRTRG